MQPITRTVMSSLEHTAYLSIDRTIVVPQCITRFDTGSRVEVRRSERGGFAVRATRDDHRRVFEEEAWSSAV